MAETIQKTWDVPAFIVDPVTTDDMLDIAKISGVPSIERKSRSHALNIRYCVKKTAKEINMDLEHTRFIAAHLGSGFSIASVNGGKIQDVNDALLGMGPFSIERAGALPTAGLLDLVEELKFSRKQIETRLSKESGLIGYIGSRDMKEIEKIINDGDKKAKLTFDAMIYQIAKEVGSMYASLRGNIDGLILTGGVSFSEMVVKNVIGYLPFIQRYFVYQGSFELEAMTEAVISAMNNKEKVREYLSC